MKKIITLLVFLITTQSFASALVKKDEKDTTLTVIAHIVYSGEIKDPTYAIESTREIKEMWNENPTDVLLDGKSYRVVFDIKHSLAGEKFEKPTSCAFNYIQIRHKKFAGDFSYYDYVGAQRGVFYTSDDLGQSTTAAHEFGHALMLSHNHTAQKTAEEPGIMFARGTLVRPEFQYDPAATPGLKGGTLDPKFRKVRSEDIKAIPFNKLQFNQHGYACLGHGALILPR